jgi:hypothetical protein
LSTLNIIFLPSCAEKLPSTDMLAATPFLPPSARVSSNDWIQHYRNKGQVHPNLPAPYDSSIFDDADEDGGYVRIPSIDPNLCLASLMRMTNHDVGRNGTINLQTLASRNQWLKSRILSNLALREQYISHDIVNPKGVSSKTHSANAFVPCRMNEVSPPVSSIVSDRLVPTEMPATETRLFVQEADIKETDVLCGRGGKSNHHVGNKRYRQVIGEFRLKYQGTYAKTDKTALSRAIVGHVHGYGGRFLKRDRSGKWILLTKGEARKKTAQALRETKQLKWIGQIKESTKNSKL